MKIHHASLVGLALLVGGCEKKASAPASPPARVVASDEGRVGVVPGAEASAHFAAVNKELELGGTMYAYIDVDGDLAKLGASLGVYLRQLVAAQPALAPLVQQNFPALMDIMGLTDIKAVGLSSVREGAGDVYRNRAFMYIPGQRRGFLAGLGGPSAPFLHVDLAPQNADLYAETEVDLPAIYRTVRALVEKVGGQTAENSLDDSLRKAEQDAAISILGLLQNLKGHAGLVLRIQPENTVTLPDPSHFVIPEISALACIDGIAAVAEQALRKSKSWVEDAAGSRTFHLVNPLPIPSLQPVAMVDSGIFYIGTSRAFLDECRSRKKTLVQSAEFQAALGHVGREGNGLLYIHPQFYRHLRAASTLNPNAPAQVLNALQLITANLPHPTQPMVTVRTNLPDGILIKSYWDHSLKQELAMLSIYNPVTIGMMAAFAIPAFQKVRVASQEKAVMNNLRMISAAADQYRLENNGRTPVLSDLVGPSKYITKLESVAGESYGALRFQAGAVLRVRLQDGRVIAYPVAPPPRRD